MTRLGKALAVLALALAFVPVAASMQSADATLQAATAYVSTFEKAFALLVSEESYVQEIRRLSGGGGNLSRSNPGGGIQSGATVRQPFYWPSLISAPASRPPGGVGWWRESAVWWAR